MDMFAWVVIAWAGTGKLFCPFSIGSDFNSIYPVITLVFCSPVVFPCLAEFNNIIHNPEFTGKSATGKGEEIIHAGFTAPAPLLYPDTFFWPSSRAYKVSKNHGIAGYGGEVKSELTHVK